MLFLIGCLLASHVFLRACEIRGVCSDELHPSLRRLALLVAACAALSVPALLLAWVAGFAASR